MLRPEAQISWLPHSGELSCMEVANHGLHKLGNSAGAREHSVTKGWQVRQTTPTCSVRGRFRAVTTDQTTHQTYSLRRFLPPIDQLDASIRLILVKTYQYQPSHRYLASISRVFQPRQHLSRTCSPVTGSPASASHRPNDPCPAISPLPTTCDCSAYIRTILAWNEGPWTRFLPVTW